MTTLKLKVVMAKSSLKGLLITYVACAVSFSQFSFAEEASFSIFQEGIDFTEVPSSLTQEAANNQPLPELVLVFWYGSESSFQVLSALNQGAYRSNTTLWPAVFRERWRQAGKLTLRANRLGFTTEQHLALMQKVITGQPDWSQSDTEQSLLAPIIENMGEDQVSKEELELTLRDQSVPKELKSVQNRINSYPISSVPTIIFKGQFVITAEQAKTSRRLLQILDFLNKRQYQLTNESSGDQQQ